MKGLRELAREATREGEKREAKRSRELAGSRVQAARELLAWLYGPDGEPDDAIYDWQEPGDVRIRHAGLLLLFDGDLLLLTQVDGQDVPTQWLPVGAERMIVSVHELAYAGAPSNEEAVAEVRRRALERLGTQLAAAERGGSDR